jgi:hypothetical protein
MITGSGEGWTAEPNSFAPFRTSNLAPVFPPFPEWNFDATWMQWRKLIIWSTLFLYI